MTKKKHETKSRHNYFSSTILSNMEGFVRQARKDLKGVEFDTFVVRGMSGAIAGAMLARSMKKNLYVIRKEDDDSHDGNRPFGDMGEAWVFLDDFISSGNTFAKTWDAVQSNLGVLSEYVWEEDKVIETPIPVAPCVGAYLYRDKRFRNPQQLTEDMQYWYPANVKRNIL